MKRIPYIISLACCLALTSTTHGQTATDTEATFELGRQMVQNRQFKKAAALLEFLKEGHPEIVFGKPAAVPPANACAADQ